jgi:hypothetical protein
MSELAPYLTFVSLFLLTLGTELTGPDGRHPDLLECRPVSSKVDQCLFAEAIFEASWLGMGGEGAPQRAGRGPPEYDPKEESKRYVQWRPAGYWDLV